MKGTGNRGKSERIWRGYWMLVLFAVTCGAVGLRSQSGDTASSFTFTRLVTSQNTDSGIALFNPNRTDAAVTLSLTGKEGKAVGSLATVTVPALGLIQQLPWKRGMV